MLRISFHLLHTYDSFFKPEVVCYGWATAFSQKYEISAVYDFDEPGHLWICSDIGLEWLPPCSLLYLFSDCFSIELVKLQSIDQRIEKCFKRFLSIICFIFLFSSSSHHYHYYCSCSIRILACRSHIVCSILHSLLILWTTGLPVNFLKQPCPELSQPALVCSFR